MKVGFFSFGFMGTSLDEGLKELSNIGYEAVEISTWEKSWAEKLLRRLDTEHYKVAIPTWQRGHAYPDDLSLEERKRIKDMCDSLAIEISALSVHLNCFSPSDIFSKEEGRKKILEYVGRCFELASQWDVEVITTCSGAVPDAMRSEEAWDKLYDIVEVELEYARKHKIKIGWEAHLGELISSPGDLQRLMEKINDPLLGINLDCSHFMLGGFDPLEATDRLAKYVIHTHLKGVKGKVSVVPAKDEDFPTEVWVKRLQDSGYNGTISVELMPEVNTLPEKAKKAFSYLRPIIH